MREHRGGALPAWVVVPALLVACSSHPGASPPKDAGATGGSGGSGADDAGASGSTGSGGATAPDAGAGDRRSGDATAIRCDPPYVCPDGGGSDPCAGVGICGVLYNYYAVALVAATRCTL